MKNFKVRILTFEKKFRTQNFYVAQILFYSILSLIYVNTIFYTYLENNPSELHDCSLYSISHTAP